MENQPKHHDVSSVKQAGSDWDAASTERGKETKGKGRLEKRRGRCPHLSRWLLAIGALLFLSVGVMDAFTTTFGQFRAYDDEGFLMVTVQGYVKGNPLYDRVYTVYGPVYYFYEWILHKVAAIPLTNDATAGLCVAHWVLAAALLALAGFRMTRSALLAVFIFMQAIVHLEPLSNEPGHPQEVVIVMLGMSCLVVGGGLKHRLTLPLLAALGTGLLFTKINVGGFLGMALGLSMLCCTSGGAGLRAGSWIITLVSSVIPVFLMQSHYGEEWARHYSLQMALSLLAVGLTANIFVGERVIRLRDWGWAATASAIVSGLILLILLVNGSTLLSIWKSLVSSAAKIGGVFYVPLQLENWAWSAWAALAAAAVMAGLKIKRSEESMFVSLSVIKAVYGIMGTWVLVFEPVSQLGCLLPWSWLLIAGKKKMDKDLFPRIFLSFLAVWQGLQAYPVAGTQVAIGTLIGVLVFSVCLWDAISAFATTSLLRLPLPKVASVGGSRLVPIGVLLALLEVFSIKWCNPVLEWREYETKESMGLPGCHYRRINPDDAIQYRKLAKILKTKSDTFFIFPGLNSMYFWTDKRPPTYFNISGEGNMLTEPQQMEIVEALKQAGRSLVVLRIVTGLSGPLHGELKAGPLADFVFKGYDQIDSFAQFIILAPRQP